MPRIVVLVAALALAASGCVFGGDDEAAGFCDSAEELRALQQEASSAGQDPESFGEFVSNAKVVTADLAASAPEDVKGDADTLSEGFTEIDETLAGVDYDLSKLKPKQQQQLSNPELSQATTAVTTFIAEECEIDVTGAGSSSESEDSADDEKSDEKSKDDTNKDNKEKNADAESGDNADSENAGG